MTEAQQDMAERASGTLEGTLGFEITEMQEEFARGHFDVVERVRQPMGIVHGGTYAAYAETIASATTFTAVQPESIAMGQSNHTSFLRPVSEGRVHAEARAVHRGRTSWVWEVDFKDDQGRLCAVTRVT